MSGDNAQENGAAAAGSFGATVLCEPDPGSTRRTGLVRFLTIAGAAIAVNEAAWIVVLGLTGRWSGARGVRTLGVSEDDPRCAAHRRAVAATLRRRHRRCGGAAQPCQCAARFTTLAERIPPEAVVAKLNAIFARFDELAEMRGLEKIKTIGDVYEVASGIA